MHKRYPFGDLLGPWGLQGGAKAPKRLPKGVPKSSQNHQKPTSVTQQEALEMLRHARPPKNTPNHQIWMPKPGSNDTLPVICLSVVCSCLLASLTQNRIRLSCQSCQSCRSCQSCQSFQSTVHRPTRGPAAVGVAVKYLWKMVLP